MVFLCCLLVGSNPRLIPGYSPRRSGDASGNCSAHALLQASPSLMPTSRSPASTDPWVVLSSLTRQSLVLGISAMRRIHEWVIDVSASSTSAVALSSPFPSGRKTLLVSSHQNQLHLLRAVAESAALLCRPVAFHPTACLSRYSALALYSPDRDTTATSHRLSREPAYPLHQYIPSFQTHWI